MDVRVIVPNSHIDKPTVRRASRDAWGSLLQAGVRIAEFQPTMFHVKSIVVDEYLSSVGSTNVDRRSFHLNDEANLNVLDADFAREQAKIFEDDWQRSREVSLQVWENRPMATKLIDASAALVRFQL